MGNASRLAQIRDHSSAAIRPRRVAVKEHVAHFDRPQGRDERTPPDHRLAQSVGRIGRFVGEDPCHHDRAVEHERRQYRRPSSIICRTESPLRSWVS